MSEKTPFQIQQSGNDETLSATVIERMEPRRSTVCWHTFGSPEST